MNKRLADGYFNTCPLGGGLAFGRFEYICLKSRAILARCRRSQEP
jgi:hypothetical protein